MNIADHSDLVRDEKPPWVWIDGAVVPVGEARVPVSDHGFLYGDSIYETFRTIDGRPFAVEPHLERLERSAAAIELTLPLSRNALVEAIDAVVEAAPSDREVGIRLMVTRGAGPLGLDFSRCEPQAILFGWPILPGPHPHAETGVAAVISTIRRNPPGALNPHIKSGNFLNNILAYQEAKRAGAFEAILLTTEETVAEGTTSNVFWIRDGELRGPDDRGILLGITRREVQRLGEQHGLPCRVGRYPCEELTDADELFITSTLKAVLPVVELDGHPVGAGEPGPVTRRFQGWYDAHIRHLV
ncbi:MAG: aminotransferase class IV [Planctomycetota bacterium]